MKVNIQTPNFVADIKLVNFIEKRLAKLEQFYDKIIYADVFLKVQKTSEKENKTVEVLLSVPGDDLIVSAQNPIQIFADKKTAAYLPYALVRRNLWARLHQNVFH